MRSPILGLLQVTEYRSVGTSRSVGRWVEDRAYAACSSPNRTSQSGRSPVELGLRAERPLARRSRHDRDESCEFDLPVPAADGRLPVITLPLEFVLGARVYRRPAALIFALLPVVIIFSIWDIAGILRDHWSYNPRFVTGLQLIFGHADGGAGLLRRGADLRAAHLRGRRPGARSPARDRATARPIGRRTPMPEYTLLTVIGRGRASCCSSCSGCGPGSSRTLQYWVSMVIVFAFQIPVDGWLTKLSRPDRDLQPGRDARDPRPVGHPDRGLRLRVRHGDPRYPALAPMADAAPTPKERRGRRRDDVITTENVAEAFDEAAPRYDLMVGLNPGYHRHLAGRGRRPGRDAAERRRRRPLGSLILAAAPGPRPEPCSDRWRRRGPAARAWSGSTRRPACWTRPGPSPGRPASDSSVGTAEELVPRPRAVGSGATAVDGVFAAYLFRNVAERDKVLAEVHDLLADGGTLVVQEYSVAGSRRAAAIWSLVCWLVVIPLSWLTSRQTRLYRYLWRSVLDFDSVQSLRRPAVRAPASSTSRCARCPAGSAASCTPSAPASPRCRSAP